MKVNVTKEGVLIPRQLLKGVSEVEICKENGRILILPLITDDPISQLGKHPVKCGVSDASENHDSYLYGTDT